MSKWIEENNCHILEGHGNKFVVCHVLYSKQLPPKWEIKQSPFLFDVNKRFETLDKAKTYCEDRYKELNGQRNEITRLRNHLKDVIDILNQIPNTKINHIVYKDTYEYISYLESVVNGFNS